MDREALSRWMTACISSPLPSAATADAAYFSESRGGRKGILGGNAAPVVVVVNAAASAKAATTTTADVIHIGPYDQSVSAVLSRYSMTFGSGRLTSSEFRDLYVEATWAGYVNDVVRRRISPNDDDDDDDDDDEEEEGGGRKRRRVRRYRIPSAESGIVFADRKNTERMILAGASLSIVWRDLEAHGVFSPAEEERVRALLEMERRLRPANASAGGGEDDRDGRSGRSGRTTPPLPPLMDECELYDEYEESLSRRFSSGGGGLADDGDYADDDVMGAESAWDFLGRRKKGGKGGGGGGGINREKGSHELVEMASDGRTPKRIRDGQFVFIDEETCIGCVQVSRAVVYDPRLFDSRCPVVVYFVYGAFATERDESVTYRHRACVISLSFSLISKSLIPPRFVRAIPQCAQIAPSSFKMIEDSGRARTYQQSSALDVENAVMVSRDIYIHICPTFVLAMHHALTHLFYPVSSPPFWPITANAHT